MTDIANNKALNMKLKEGQKQYGKYLTQKEGTYVMSKSIQIHPSLSDYLMTVAAFGG